MQDKNIKIEYIKVSELKFADYNPRNATEEQFKQLAENIKKFGFVDPVLVNSAENRKNIIIGGHFRVRVAKHIGIEEVPVVYLNIPEIEKEKELNVRLNKNTGQWDFDLLANNFDVQELMDWGFTDIELDIMPPKEKKDKDDDEIPEQVKSRDTKIGDMYKLGDHIIMCGSSTDTDDVAKLMDVEARCMFTSPPYNMNAGLYNEYEDNMERQNYIEFNIRTIQSYQKYIKGFIFWNISYNKNSGDSFIEVAHRIPQETDFKFLELICWNKKHGMPITSDEAITRQYEDIFVFADEETKNQDIDYMFMGRNDTSVILNKKNNRGITNYWEIGTNNTQLKDHKACYPVELPINGIKLSTKVGEVVVDPFLGSGTNLIACEKTGRKCRGMELDPRYVDIAIQRWEDWTGKKAEKITVDNAIA